MALIRRFVRAMGYRTAVQGFRTAVQKQ